MLVDSLLRQMSPEEKVAQCLMPAVYSSSDSHTLDKIKEYARLGVGGIILLKGDPSSVTVIADSLRKWSHIPPFIAIDAEWGLSMRLKDTPSFPRNGDLPENITENQMFEYGEELARECRILGINMILGPVLDIADRGSYIGRRSYGTNPKRVALLGVAYAQGLESGNIVSVAKHFPGHGAVSSDTHKARAVIDRSLQSLDSIDLYPFRQYIRHGLSAVMAGHLAFPAIDPDALPAAVSPIVLTDLLRKDLGFKGLILTDALNMTGAAGTTAADAVAAGADIVLAPLSTVPEINNMMRQFYPDSVSNRDNPSIDEHVRRILFRKLLLGIPSKVSDKDEAELNRELGKYRR